MIYDWFYQLIALIFESDSNVSGIIVEPFSPTPLFVSELRKKTTQDCWVK